MCHSHPLLKHSLDGWTRVKPRQTSWMLSLPYSFPPSAVSHKSQTPRWYSKVRPGGAIHLLKVWGCLLEENFETIRKINRSLSLSYHHIWKSGKSIIHTHRERSGKLCWCMFQNNSSGCFWVLVNAHVKLKLYIFISEMKETVACAHFETMLMTVYTHGNWLQAQFVLIIRV